MEIDSEGDDILMNNISAESESDSDEINTRKIQSTRRAEFPPQTKQIRQQNLPSNAPDFWKDVSDHDLGNLATIPVCTVPSGPVLPKSFDANSKPIDYFDLFFNHEILSHICNEINLSANKRTQKIETPHSRLKKWIDVVDLKAFLGTIINMGLMPLPAASIEAYFSTAWEERIPFYGDVFNRDEFLSIFWNLNNHTDNESLPVLHHMKKMCRLYYNPTDCVSVNESNITFNGRFTFSIYNPKQLSRKFRLQIYFVSDCKNGYLCDFLPYYGSGSLIPKSNLLITTQIVKLLTESVMNKCTPARRGLHVFSDRSLSSPELAEELLKIGCYFTGTVMTNAVGMPPGLQRTAKQMVQGELLSLRKGPTLVVSWKDKRVVHMISTFSKGSRRNMTTVRRTRDPTTLRKPDVVMNYIKNMGGVNHSDNFIFYKFMQHIKKWHRKLFFWLFEVALINAYLLYKEVQQQNNGKPLTQRKFRLSLVKDLVAQKVASQPKCQNKKGHPVQGPPEERLERKPHFMNRREKGSRQCVVCLKIGLRRETIYFCKTCTALPPLHPDICFEKFHTAAIPETCCALACTNTSEFHTLTCLPQDADNRHKWINQIDRHDWTPSETSSLCEIHFDADAWELNAAGVKVLKGDAVPTLYLHGEVIKSWVTLDGSGNVLKTASGSEENNDASTAKSTSVYIKEELPAVDIDDSIDKDASVYVKQEVLEPDIEMTEEPSDVEEPFETVYFNSNIDKTLEGDALSTETIRIKTLAETDSQTIVPEIAHVNIKTEVMDEPEEMMEEDGTAGAEAETWNCVECCVSFEERWTMEQHVLDVHSDSERARSLRKKQSDGSMLKNTGSSKSSARSKSISKVPLTHSVTCTTATTSSDATTQVSPAQAVPTIVGPAVSQADQAAAAKQFLVLIPQSTSVKHPMYLPLAKSSPTHTAVSPSPPPPPQPALPSVPSVPAVPTALPITPTCATDSSEMFCISLAHFPEATRLVIKKKLMEVIHTVERLKVSPEMIVIARKAPEIKPKL